MAGGWSTLDSMILRLSLLLLGLWNGSCLGYLALGNSLVSWHCIALCILHAHTLLRRFQTSPGGRGCRNQRDAGGQSLTDLPRTDFDDFRLRITRDMVDDMTRRCDAVKVLFCFRRAGLLAWRRAMELLEHFGTNGLGVEEGTTRSCLSTHVAREKSRGKSADLETRRREKAAWDQKGKSGCMYTAW
ncbi:hypothetical protein VTI74DRAFT_5432 [Chaetomium olivicolor]